VARTTLFNTLSRAPWWLSLAIAVALFVGLRTLLPDVIAAGTAIPFIGIASYAAWRQWRSPGDDMAGEALEGLRKLSSEEFSARLAQGFRKDGYEVSSISSGELELQRGGRLTLVAAKRWKAAHSGIAPLKALAAAREARQADECLFVASGELSPQAEAFAAANRVQLLKGGALARLVR
jgi:restriction system protein